MNRINIRQTASIQELADFWDTHDLTDFEDEREEVDEPVFELAAQLLIALAPGELETLNALAQLRGISPENLIREWVIERIDRTHVT